MNRYRRVWTAAALSAGLALLVRSAPAVDWSNPAGGAFQTGTNWAGGAPPSADDVASFDLGSQTYTVAFNGNVENSRLVVGDDTVTFDLNAFNYVLTDATDPPRSIIVGDAAADAAHLTLLDGDVSAQAVVLGRSANATGRLTVDATATLAIGSLYVAEFGNGRLDLNGDSTTGAIIVARNNDSSGEIHIAAGATVVTGGSTLMGSASGGSTAAATVDGPGTTWNISSQLIVGRADGDVASLAITGGATATADLPLIGNNPGAQGALTVDGAGSSFSSPRRIHVGVGGEGAMVVSGGAQVSSMQTGSPSQSSGIVGFTQSGGGRGDGSVTIRDANSLWSQDGGMSIGYGGDGALTIESGGRLESVDGFVSRTDGSTGTARIRGANSRWSTTAGFYLAGDQTTPGDVGTLSLTDGGRLATVGYKQYDEGTLQIEIDALASPQGLDASGAVALDGTLALQVDSAFTPAFGDTISGFLNWGSRSGVFSAITGRALPGGLVLAHVYAASALELTPTVVGDGNLDGQVTGADYTIWADNFGTTGGAGFDQGDYNADGQVTGADYTLWADNFGSSATPAVAVPEPSAFWLAALALLLPPLLSGGRGGRQR